MIDPVLCFAWKQHLMMSMERYLKLRKSQEKILGPGAFRFFRKIPDGECYHCFLGTEVEVRELAREKAKQWGVKRWSLKPLWGWSHLYKGGVAYQDDTLILNRVPDPDIVGDVIKREAG